MANSNASSIRALSVVAFLGGAFLPAVLGIQALGGHRNGHGPELFVLLLAFIVPVLVLLGCAAILSIFVATRPVAARVLDMLLFFVAGYVGTLVLSQLVGVRS